MMNGSCSEFNRAHCLAALLLFSFACQSIHAAQPWRGEQGITESVAQIMARQAAARESITVERSHRLRRDDQKRSPSANTLRISQFPAPQAGAREFVAPRAPQTIGSSFLAIDRKAANAVPPDTMGAVGPTQIFVCLNGRFRVFDRNGVSVPALDVDSDVFFQTVRNGALTTDPRVRFDRFTNRWFVTMITEATVNRVMVAVSSGPELSALSNFTFFQFQHDFNTTNSDPDHNAFADYDTLGLDVNALYVGVSIFGPNNGSFKGTSCYVIRKADLLNGTLTVTPFRQIAKRGDPGIFTAQGVDNEDPNAAEGYFIGIDNVASDVLVMHRVSDPGGSPSISPAINISVPNFGGGSAGSAPALGSVRPIDDNDGRLFQASIRNGSLYTAHNIEVDVNGTASDRGARDGARWYEISNIASVPTLRQSGTLFDSAVSTPRSYIFPTCCLTGQGHMALGCTVTGANLHLSVATSGRLAGDPLGTLQAPIVAITGTGNYNAETAGVQRWGDYSRTCVDPNDNMTVWTFQEYCPGSNNWGVQVVQLKAPPPARPVACSPSTIPPNVSNFAVTVTGDDTNGAGFYDPGAGFPNHISASLAGSGIAVNSVKYVDPLTIVLNVSTVNAASGPRVLTVTNPDGQSTSSSGGVLCVATAGAPTAAGLTIEAPIATLIDTPFSVKVSGVDNCSVPVPYTGTVHFTSSDPGAALPADYTFVASDSGARNFLLKLKQFGDVTITVTDAANNFSASAVINVSTGPLLTARPAGKPNPGVVGIPVNFSVSAKSGVTPPLVFSWDFGDTFTATGQLATHTYAAAGSYKVTLSIEDSAGGKAAANFTQVILPLPVFQSAPTAVPNPAGVHQPVLFSAAAVQPGGDTLAYNWTFGDGATANAQFPTHAYPAEGNYTVTVTASDARGGSAQDSVTVLINPAIVGVGDDSDGDGFSDDFEIAWGSDPNDSRSTPTGDKTASAIRQPLVIKKLTTKLIFSRNLSDSIQLQGSIPVNAGFQVLGAKVGVDVSGVTRIFTLDAHGKSKDGFRLQVKASRGVVATQMAKFTMSLTHGSFAATLAKSGFANQTVKEKVLALNAAIVFDSAVFQTTQIQSYTAKVDKSGSSKRRPGISFGR